MELRSKMPRNASNPGRYTKRNRIRNTGAFHYLNAQKRALREYARDHLHLGRNWRTELRGIRSSRGIALSELPSSDWTQDELDALYMAWGLKRPSPSELRRTTTRRLLGGQGSPSRDEGWDEDMGGEPLPMLLGGHADELYDAKHHFELLKPQDLMLPVQQQPRPRKPRGPDGRVVMLGGRGRRPDQDYEEDDTDDLSDDKATMGLLSLGGAGSSTSFARPVVQVDSPSSFHQHSASAEPSPAFHVQPESVPRSYFLSGEGSPTSSSSPHLFMPQQPSPRGFPVSEPSPRPLPEEPAPSAATSAAASSVPPSAPASAASSPEQPAGPQDASLSTDAAAALLALVGN